MAVSRKMISIYMVLAIALLAGLSEARDHLVGGQPGAWKVSSSDPDSLNKWSSKTRFQIGDNLVWKYDSKTDSVIQVTKEAYQTCNTTNPIATYKNDETKVVLDKPGPHYFISGLKDNCDKGEKVIVVVITPRKSSSAGAPSAATPSAATGGGAPAMAPMAESGMDNPGPAVAPASGGALGGVKGGGVGLFVAVLVGFLMI